LCDVFDILRISEQMNAVCSISVSVVCVGLIVFASIGCAPGVSTPDGMPDLQPTVLMITQGGEPLEGASVQCIADDPALARWACGGFSDSNGEVVIKTLGQYTGAPAGIYKVTVSKELIESSTSQGNDPGSSNITKSFALVDPKFKSAETTPASISVTGGENKPPAIDLGTAVKIAAPTL